jgi:hypothetical protein
MKKVIKFNDGQITFEFNSAKRIGVQNDSENNTTLLVIPGLPTNFTKAKSKVTVTLPKLTNSKRYFITADDHKGNSVLAMVQGELNDKTMEKAKEITDKQYIRLAQGFLDEMKGEQHHE